MQSLKSDLIEFQDDVDETVDADNCFSHIAHLVSSYPIQAHAQSSTAVSLSGAQLMKKITAARICKPVFIQTLGLLVNLCGLLTHENTFFSFLQLTSKADVQLTNFHLSNYSVNRQMSATKTRSNQIRLVDVQPRTRVSN